MPIGSQYARGDRAWGICQRCGLRALLKELVFDGYYRDLRVHPECRDDRHPQERPPIIRDPTTLWKPSPEQPGIPPVLTGELMLPETPEPSTEFVFTAAFFDNNTGANTVNELGTFGTIDTPYDLPDGSTIVGLLTRPGFGIRLALYPINFFDITDAFTSMEVFQGATSLGVFLTASQGSVTSLDFGTLYDWSTAFAFSVGVQYTVRFT